MVSAPLAPAMSGAIIVVRKTIVPTGVHVFETIAFVSTIGFFVVFVVLFQADRASRRGDESPNS